MITPTFTAPRLVVSGLSGGGGKTLLSLGLVRALTLRGFRVKPCKKGPDYIDAAWLGLASGRTPTNLDPFFLTDARLRALFRSSFGDADLAVIEGTRGLYDGRDVQGSCSPAALARALGAPVLLTLTVTKMTRTAAAVIAGLARFEPVNLAGVVLNRVASSRHAALIRQILRLGSPVALQDLLVSLSFLAIIGIANSMGTVPSAGVGVAEKLCAFVMLVPSAYMQSMSAFVAQNIGAGLETRARRALLYGVLSSLMAGLLMGWAAFFHGDVLAGIFADDPAVIAAAWEYLKAYAIDCLLTSFLFCFVGFFNGCGQTLFVMAQGMVGALGVRLPVALLVSRAADSSLFHLGLATPASTVVQIFLCGIWYLRRSHRLNRLGLIRK